MDEQSKTANKIAYKIIDAGLAAPAIAFLEMHKPLQGIFYTAFIFFEPLLKLCVSTVGLKQAHLFFEDRLFENTQSIEGLITAIEKEQEGREQERRAL